MGLYKICVWTKIVNEQNKFEEVGWNFIINAVHNEKIAESIFLLCSKFFSFKRNK